MKGIVITNTGDLTPTKGGKLPDARTPPPGFSKTMYDKEHFSMKKKTKYVLPFTPKSPVVKEEPENLSPGRYEETETKATEEIIIYPDGSSKKLSKNKSADDYDYVPPKEKSYKKSSLSSTSAPLRGSKLWTPNSSLPKPKKKVGRPVGRPRSRSKSPRGGSKSPSRAKSPAQATGSPRGRGRPPKDKSLLKTPEKKPAMPRVPVHVPTVEEIFTGEGVLDLSMGTKKKTEASKDVTSVPAVKEEVGADGIDKPLDLSKSSEDVPKTEIPKVTVSEVSSPPAQPRPRGRPPLSPEKKRARELAIAASIDAVVDRNREEMQKEEEMGKQQAEEETEESVIRKESNLLEVPKEVEIPVEVKEEPPSAETNVTENIIVAYDVARVKEEPQEVAEVAAISSPTPSETKKKKKKNKDKNGEQVKEKLKEKIKLHQDSDAKEIKKELLSDQEETTVSAAPESGVTQEKTSGVTEYQASPVPVRVEDVKAEPVRMFTVGFPEPGKDGDSSREKSKDRERSKVNIGRLI